MTSIQSVVKTFHAKGGNNFDDLFKFTRGCCGSDFTVVVSVALVASVATVAWVLLSSISISLLKQEE